MSNKSKSNRRRALMLGLAASSVCAGSAHSTPAPTAPQAQRISSEAFIRELSEIDAAASRQKSAKVLSRTTVETAGLFEFKWPWLGLV